MKSRRYAIDRGGPKRIEVRWERGQRDVTVLFDGAPVASFDRLSLDIGASVRLPDETTVLLERIPRRWWSIAVRDELRVERQGIPVPGSDGDPRTIGGRAARLVVLFGLLLVTFSALWGIFARGGGWPLVALEGLVLLVLGVLAAFGLRLPIALAAFVLVADSLLLLGIGVSVNPGSLVIRALVVVHLIRAWRRMAAKVRPSAGPALSA